MAGGCPARPVWARRTPPRVPRGDAPRRRRVRRQPADGAAVKARAAFALMELLVAIVVAGIVALLVYGAAGAAIATQERLTARRAAAQTERAMRAVLTDALRNARSSTRFGETVLVIEDGATPAGRPADRLSFVTSGGTPPLTDEVDWRVVFESTADGVTLTGVPLGMSNPPHVVLRP